MSLFLWLSVAVIAVIALLLIYYYNKFVVLGNRIDNSLSQIDVQLKKRADLVPNLMNSVKGIMKQEREIMKDVTDARKTLMGAKSLEKKMQAGAELQNALRSVFAIAENYPQLRSNENFLHLQQELSTIEDRIAYARQFYNDSILSYNNTCQSFPGNFFANLFKRKSKQFLQIPQEEKAVPKISF